METVHSRLEAQRVKLQETYGTDNINLQTGEITYTDSSTKKPENGEVNKKN
jgi:hypothetical protein